MLKIILLLFLTTISNIATSPCPKNCECIDQRGAEDVRMLCAKIDQFENEFDIKMVNNSVIHIECSTNLPYDNYLNLPPLNLTKVQWIRFLRCNFRNATFDSIFKQLNLTDVHAVLFNNFNLKMYEEMNLNLFKNLNKIKRVEFISTINLKRELFDFNIFHNLTQLKVLDLHNNKGLNKIVNLNYTNLSQLEILDLSHINLNELPEEIKNLTNLRTIYLWSNNLTHIPDDLFDKMVNLKLLDLHKNKISNLNPNLLHNLNELTTIDLSYNNLSDLNENFFKNNEYLKIINLSYNKLGKISENLLKNQLSLRVLKLETCGLNEIPTNLLKYNHGLQELFLTNNLLTDLDGFVWPNDLEVLYLGYNSINKLNSKNFRNLNRLQKLYLNHNQIKYISKGIFKDLPQLTILHLEDNEIRTIESQAFVQLEKLEYLNLNRNGLSFDNYSPFINDYSPFGPLKNLKELHLQKNGLKSIPASLKISMLNLKTLDLSYNNISYLEFSSIQFLSKHLYVDLEYNQILTINFRHIRKMEQQYDDSRKSTVIRLSNNPLICDCRSYDFIQIIKKEISLPKIQAQIDFVTSDLFCQTPELFQNRKITEINTKLITCPYNFESNLCPAGCNCFYRNWDHVFYVNCSNQHLTKLPDYLPKISSNISLILDISYNELKELNLNFTNNTQYKNLEQILASNNNLTSINFFNVPGKLQVLELHSNNLQKINMTLLAELKRLTRLRLDDNPWNCECHNLDFVLFIQKHYKQIHNLANITCKDYHFDKSILKLTPNDLCPFNVFIYVAVTLSLIFICLIMSLVIVYLRHQMEINVWLDAHNIHLSCCWRNKDDSIEKLYDAFVSYSHKDEQFIVNHLIPNLEHHPRKYQLCIHSRDWIPGNWIPDQIAYSVENSHRTIVVLSRNFLNSVWGKMEFRAAHLASLSEKRRHLIIIKLDDIGPIDELDAELRAYLKMNTYIEWGTKNFWDMLRFALPHKMTLSNNGRILSETIAKTLRIEQVKLEMKQKEKCVIRV